MKIVGHATGVGHSSSSFGGATGIYIIYVFYSDSLGRYCGLWMLHGHIEALCFSMYV